MFTPVKADIGPPKYRVPEKLTALHLKHCGLVQMSFLLGRLGLLGGAMSVLGGVYDVWKRSLSFSDKYPQESRPIPDRVGLMVEKSHPQNRIVDIYI